MDEVDNVPVLPEITPVLVTEAVADHGLPVVPSEDDGNNLDENNASK